MPSQCNDCKNEPIETYCNMCRNGINEPGCFFEHIAPEPRDIDPHQPGVKLDAGKIDLDIYYRSFARTILFNLPDGVGVDNHALVLSCLDIIDTYRHETDLRIAQALMDVFTVAKWHDSVRRVADAGAKKHTPLGFISVENGQHRYWLAFLRHLHAVIHGEEIGPDFGYPHVDHMAWNVWAVQELSQ